MKNSSFPKYNSKLVVLIPIIIDLYAIIAHCIFPYVVSNKILLQILIGVWIPTWIVYAIEFVYTIIPLLRISGRRIIDKTKYFLLYVLIIVGSVVIPTSIKGNEETDVNTRITLYGALITFLGTFSLGYITLIRDKRREENQMKENIIKLRDTIQDVLYDIKAPKKQTINYDEGWSSYYSSFREYTGIKDESIKDSLRELFRTVDNINLHEKSDEKMNIWNRFLYNQDTSIQNYNFWDAYMIISTYPYEGGGQVMITTPWIDKAGTNKIIEQYKNDYYAIIENWLYCYLLKNGIKEVEYYKVEQKLIDILFEKNICNEIDLLYRKRAIAKIIFEILIMINNQSERLIFIWGTISLKNQ